mgnify:CR=1 FL=1
MSILASLVLGGVTLTLSPQARVRGTEIELSAIATVVGDDAAEVERVRALKLGYSPAPGHSRLIAAQRLEADVERMLAGVDVTLAGASACRVLPATEVLTGAALTATAKGEIVRWTQGRDAQLELVTSLSDIEVPTSDRPIDLRAVVTETQVRAGVLNVPIRISVDGQLYRTIWSNWRVTLFQDVNVLKNAVRAGEALSPEMFERKRVALTTGGESPAPLELTRGVKAARDMAAGSMLKSSDVALDTLVKRGDTLFLEIRRGAITARVAASADQDGRAGDRIRITLLDTGKSITAVVQSRELAVIDLAREG